MFGFFLGKNLADAAANGSVFASPDPVTITKTAEAADRGGGVLFLYGNYAGDNLNFDKAADNLKEKVIRVKTIRVWDDIASAPRERMTDRRGIAGDVLMLKIAGAACAQLPLDEAYRVTAKARNNLYSIGVGLEGATIPSQKEPIFPFRRTRWSTDWVSMVNLESAGSRWKLRMRSWKICWQHFWRTVESVQAIPFAPM